MDQTILTIQTIQCNTQYSTFALCILFTVFANSKVTGKEMAPLCDLHMIWFSHI